MFESMENRDYLTMSQIAVFNIKNAIMRGTYKPGQKLIETKLMKDLKLGRIAIREALRELSAIGLVASIPNKGSVVAERLNSSEVAEIFKIRYHLEGKAAYIATKNITSEYLSELEKIHIKISERQWEPQDYMLLNKDFHLRLYLASGWKFLCQIITQIYDVLLVFRGMYPIPQESLNTCIEEHNKIIEALRANNPEKVQETIVNHIHEGFDNLMEMFADS